MIYDCFMFFNELDLLEIRLNLMNPYVDKFIIVESTITHSGKPKPLYFNDNKERFKEFSDKIIHIIKKDYNLENTLKHLIDDRNVKHYESTHFATWLTETENRNSIIDGLKECDKDDIILISDVDEIPNMKMINLSNIQDNIIYDCEGDMFYYYMNVKMKDQKWINTKILKYSTLIENNLQPTDVVRYYGDIRKEKIENCGWHFSYLGGEEKIKEKLDAFMHQEMMRPSVNNEYNIKSSVNDLRDLLGRHYIYEKTNLNHLPTYILENIEKYKKFILS